MTTAELKLYEVTDSLLEIASDLIDAEGILSPELEERLDGLEGKLEDKIERTMKMVRRLRINGAGAEEEGKRLLALGKSRTAAAERLEEYVKRNLIRLGRTTLDTPSFRLGVLNASRPKIRWAGDTGSIPPEFLKDPKPELDGTKAYAAHRAGTLPDGFTVETTQYLKVS